MNDLRTSGRLWTLSFRVWLSRVGVACLTIMDHVWDLYYRCKYINTILYCKVSDLLIFFKLIFILLHSLYKNHQRFYESKFQLKSRMKINIEMTIKLSKITNYFCKMYKNLSKRNKSLTKQCWKLSVSLQMRGRICSRRPRLSVEAAGRTRRNGSWQQGRGRILVAVLASQQDTNHDFTRWDLTVASGITRTGKIFLY